MSKETKLDTIRKRQRAKKKRRLELKLKNASNQLEVLLPRRISDLQETIQRLGD